DSRVREDERATDRGGIECLHESAQRDDRKPQDPRHLGGGEAPAPDLSLPARAPRALRTEDAARVDRVPVPPRAPRQPGPFARARVGRAPPRVRAMGYEAGEAPV